MQKNKKGRDGAVLRRRQFEKVRKEHAETSGKSAGRCFFVRKHRERLSSEKAMAAGGRCSQRIAPARPAAHLLGRHHNSHSGHISAMRSIFQATPRGMSRERPRSLKIDPQKERDGASINPDHPKVPGHLIQRDGQNLSGINVTGQITARMISWQATRKLIVLDCSCCSMICPQISATLIV